MDDETHHCEATTDSTGLLDAEVEGEVLLALVELAEVGAGLLVDDGEDTGDGLADGGAVGSHMRSAFRSPDGRSIPLLVPLNQRFPLRSLLLQSSLLRYPTPSSLRPTPPTALPGCLD
jgi:hypothetical protein